jgi:hypothetical protein
MTTHKPVNQHVHAEEIEEAAGLAVGGGLRAVEVAAFVFIGLLVCPPLAILAVLVVVPALVIALVVGLLGAVLSVPYLIVHRLRGHRGHRALFAQRLRTAGRALLDLAPHRIAAGLHRPGHAR